MNTRNVELGYNACPQGAPRPGVVMIHDVWGLADHTRDLARRLAGEGFAVLAIDLYRREPDVKIENPGVWMRGFSDPQALADVAAAAAWLGGHSGCTGRVGVVGFCMGGMYALLSACGGAQLAAAMNREAPAPARLAWAGNFYPLVPPRHIFSSADEYYYVYHLAPHVIEYYLGRQVTSLRHLQTEELDGVLYPLGVGARLGTGDAVIASVPGVTLTATLPDAPSPLTLSLLDVWKLVPDPAQGDGRLLRAPGDPVSIRLSDTQMQVTTPPGVMEVVIRRRSGLSVSLGLQQVLKGRATLELPPDWHADQVTAAQVVRFTPRPLKLSW